MLQLRDVDDYKDWSLQMKAILRDKELWDIVEGTDEPLKAENDDAASMAWSHKNDMALEVIWCNCDSWNLFSHAIWNITSAKIAWDTLAAKCALPKTGFEFLADDGDNYLDWSLQVKAILTDRQLWDIVEGTDDPPKAEKNDVGLELIRYSCRRSSLGNEIRYITSAKIAWDTLAAICALPKTVIECLDSIPTVIERLASIPAVIKRLDDVDNYKDWSLQVKTHLTDQQLWDIVEGTNKPPKAENDGAAFKAWSKKNALAFRVIVFSCGYRLRFAIWGITSAKIAWDTLAEICKFSKSSYIDPEEYDYVAWSIRMEAYLKAYDLWDIVEAATEPPKPENDEIAFNAWSKKNAKALYLIWESSEAFFSFKKSTRTARIAWDTLAGYHNSRDMALDVLKKFRTLVTALDIEEESPVLALASMSSAYTSGNHLKFWKQWIYNCIHITRVSVTDQIPGSTQKPEQGKSIQARNIGLGIRQIYELKLLHQLLLRMCAELQYLRGQQLREIRVHEAIIKAAKKGMVEFVTAIWRACPELVWAEEQGTRRNPFMCAVLHRQHEIFRLLCGFGLKDSVLAKTDNEGNNILHMAAMTEPSARRNTVPGAAFHMQREVQWFQEVKSIVHPSLLEAKNKSGHTPDYLFANHHKDLVDEAKNWVKETASSCTVPAALIVTIMFAAAITVPGGNNQNTGLPMFLKDTVFMVFILSDVLSLISATTSLLVFLVITSCYTEEDFLISLPKKMILGLSSLIFSIATMMINFCASLFITLDGNLWVVIPIICLATVPVFLFAWKQFHLLLDMFTSTYRPRRIFDRNVKPWI